MIGKAEVQALVEACVQDEPPACTAACPLHVDARAMLAQAAQGQWAAALGVLRRAAPFPGVLARTCPQPCVPVCRRGDAGDPVAVAAVERACVAFGASPGTTADDDVAPARVPARAGQVLVVGGGLAGATAAHDLARRGYRVVLREAAGALGGTLRSAPGLPASVLDAELATLLGLGVETALGCLVDDEALTLARAQFDAVVLAVGATGSRFGLDTRPDGSFAVDPLTGVTPVEGLFACGSACRPAGVPPSSVESTAGGRHVATSVDRFLTGVSLVAGRATETVRTTCLFTRVDDVPPAVQVVADLGHGYTRAQASAEAARCVQCSCLECVKACTYLEHFGSHPKLYARRVLHNMLMVKGEHTANRLINACSLCGLCAEVCPTGVDMGAMLQQVRRRMVATRSMPPSAHDFALRDMEFSNGEACALAAAPPGATTCTYAFFPGCQLAGSAPEQVARTYAYLTGVLDEVGILLRCCGAPADWAGRTDLTEAAWEAFDRDWAAIGRPTLVVACTSCAQQLGRHRPDVPVVSLWTVLDEHGLPADCAPAPRGATVAVHDPCTARHDSAVQDSVRSVLSRLGYTVDELEHSRQRTECCSYGGLQWLADREVAEKQVRRRIAQSPHDYLTYCVMCRDLFAARGKPTLHLLDLLGGADVQTRATRPAPGWSQRHENRARLKEDLLDRVWGVRMDGRDGAGRLMLRIADDVRAAMEDRLVLDDDVRRVVEHAESTGEALRDPRTGHLLARFRPREVTYWVEYTRDGDDVVVHRAYSHRVQVVEGVPHDG